MESEKTNATPPAEGTSPPIDTAALEALVAGKPVQMPDGQMGPSGEPPTQRDDLVEVSVKGRKVRMTKEAADVLEEFRREVRERDGRLGGENAQLRERLARLEGMLETVARPKETGPALPSPPSPELARLDFDEYHRQLLQYQAAMMIHQQQEIENSLVSRYQAEREKEMKDRAATMWVERFYAKYPHLAKTHLRPIVQSVYYENAKEINNEADVERAHARLAELAEERLLAIKNEGKEIDQKKPPRLEGSGVPPARGESAPSTVRRLSAADWQRKERARLRGDAVRKT
jgi:hypothetical protein